MDYGYDPNGNVTSKIDARQMRIEYAYDELNRLTAKGYSQNQTQVDVPVTYVYDEGSGQIGYRTGMIDVSASSTFTSAARSATWSYNSMGWVTSEARTIAGVTRTMNYDYWADGSLKQLKYPLSQDDAVRREVDYAYESGLPSTATDSLNGINFVTDARYAAHGSPSIFVLGKTGTFVGISGVFTYNARLQMENELYTTGQLDLSCTDTAGKILHLYNSYPASANNGNMNGTVNCRDASRTQIYSYDELNRIATAQSATWSQEFGYDGWGNLKEIVPANAPGLQVQINDLNRIADRSYNAAGQLVNDLGVNYQYDAEGRLTGAVGGPRSVYDGDDRRVAKEWSGAQRTLYWFSNENLVAESDTSGTLQRAYFYFGSSRVARIDNPALATGQLHFYYADHLGSTRMVTDAQGAMSTCAPSPRLSGEDESDFYPFGAEIPICDRDSNALKFTGKERDSETGLDYFGARYYGSNMGRWSSPDILNLTEDRIFNPTNTLNKYAYAANNPLRFGDPDGRDVTALFLPPHGLFPGHFMLFAHNPLNGQSALMSLGPVDTSWGSRAIQVVNGPVDGTTSFELPKSADELRQGYAALTIQTSPEEAQAVIDFLRSFDGSSWKLGGPNCTTVCRDALKAIGLLPQNYGSISPASLWSGLYERFSNPASQTFSTTSRYGEQFFRLNIPRAQGREYGFPRYGMNAFDFIMLQLKRPKACVEAHDDKGNSTGQT
jgi:RHS repeat-associated protein